jgi:cro/CI family transcriptional regulator
LLLFLYSYNRISSVICQELSEIKRRNISKKEEGMIYDTIKDVAANQGISIYRIEKDLEFPNGLISKWNKSTPSASNLAKVAKYLGVTTEKLLGDG